MSELARIELAKLKPGTKILVETEHSIYELELIDSKGKCLITGSNEFLTATEILLMGCTGHRGFLVFGEGMDFAYTDENGDLAHGNTSGLIGCKLSSVSDSGKTWNYEVWGDANEDSCTTK